MVQPGAKHASAAQLASVLVRHDVVGIVRPGAVVPEVAEIPARRKAAREHAVPTVRLARPATEHVLDVAARHRTFLAEQRILDPCVRRDLQRLGIQFGQEHLDHASPFSEIRARSFELADWPAVAVESERMDEDPAWRLMASGELVHVAADLTVTSRVVLAIPPVRQLSLDELRPEAALSQIVNVPSPRGEATTFTR